jgi:hypothetical protein
VELRLLPQNWSRGQAAPGTAYPCQWSHHRVMHPRRRVARQRRGRDSDLPQSLFALVAWIGREGWGAWASAALFVVAVLLAAGLSRGSPAARCWLASPA